MQDTQKFTGTKLAHENKNVPWCIVNQHCYAAQNT